MAPKDFFAEFKKRSVYKVAAVYVPGAAFVLGLTGNVVPALDLPAVTFRVVFWLTLLGLPVSVLIAWALEGGRPNNPYTRWSWRKIAALIISMGIAAGGLFLVQSLWKKTETSIAVLPFEGDAAVSEFAGNLLEDVLTNLASIKDLKVISRASVLSYPDKGTRKLSEIGSELKVSRIAEGSIRREGNLLLVHIELLDPATGKSVWNYNFDRFEAQWPSLGNEVSWGIATALRVAVTSAEKDRVKKEPTNKLEAWRAYHKGREIQIRPEFAKKDYLTAAKFYEEAVTIDPRFVLARARLSFMQALVRQIVTPNDEAMLGKARKNADRAIDQDANCAEAHLARGKCAQLEEDEKVTATKLSTAMALRPNDASLRREIAVTQQQLGWVADAIENYEQAAKLGPRQPRIFANYGYLLHQTGQQDKACEKLDRALALDPDSIEFHLIRAVAEISRSGDTGRAGQFLVSLPEGKDPDGQVTSARCTLAILKRDYKGALDILAAYQGEKLPSIDSGGLGQQDFTLEAEGTIRLYLGDRVRESARIYECFDSIRYEYETAVWQAPKDARIRAARALLYSWMGPGWRQAAVAEADSVLNDLEMPPPGPTQRGIILGLAKTYAWAGELDRAWTQIDRFCHLPPADYTIHNFRLDPAWDPIRSDPRFQELLKRKKL